MPQEMLRELEQERAKPETVWLETACVISKPRVIVDRNAHSRGLACAVGPEQPQHAWL